MASREIGFGLYEVRRPATSPTRNGAATGRPQPQRSNPKAPLRPVAATPSPPSSAAAGSHRPHPAGRLGGKAAVSREPAARQGETGREAAVVEAGGSHSASDVGPSTGADSGNATQALPSRPSALRRVCNGIPSAAPSSALETHLRCMVHATQPSTLPAALHDVLQQSLRFIQQDRAQHKGQQPCRRLSNLASGGLESEAARCLAHAAQASSVAAAVRSLEDFLRAHPDPDALPPPPASSSPPPSSVPSTAAVVLVGAALADVVLGDDASSSSVFPSSQLLSFLDRAVAMGHPAAMVCVGVCLRDGRGGLHRDARAGVAWLRCAAAAGYLPAMHELGESFERGDGGDAGEPLLQSSTVTADDEESGGRVDWGEAMLWYRQAAEAGYAPSQLNLGKLLTMAAEHAAAGGASDAEAVEHLSAEGRRWLQAAAAAGVEEGVRLLARLK